MTKEWQEASNEYALVRFFIIYMFVSVLTIRRKRKWTPSPVSPARATRARALCRARPKSPHRLLLLNRRQREKWRGLCFFRSRSSIVVYPGLLRVAWPRSLAVLHRGKLIKTCTVYCAIINPFPLFRLVSSRLYM